ncbi:four helix bundle protein [uncultured Bacteroides sp.]|uniref:four helix bundle protein n=1 Tax=uncultured Bacteroides sp. TaxID=162156 RepID=UPI002619E0E2|nr:four helix bundle protein [uncultured Bacteroides sp.]
MGTREYNGVLRQKCKAFAIRIVKLYQYVSTEKKETVMSKQLLRAGTAIGALQREDEHAESKLDFIHKYAIAQKECNETMYWLELLYETSYLSETEYKSIYVDAKELMRLLTSSIKTAKSNSQVLTTDR